MILVEKGAIFLEKEFLQRLKSSGSSVMLEETQETLQDHEDQDIPTMVPMASGSMYERVP